MLVRRTREPRGGRRSMAKRLCQTNVVMAKHEEEMHKLNGNKKGSAKQMSWRKIKCMIISHTEENVVVVIPSEWFFSLFFICLFIAQHNSEQYSTLQNANETSFRANTRLHTYTHSHTCTYTHKHTRRRALEVKHSQARHSCANAPNENLCSRNCTTRGLWCGQQQQQQQYSFSCRTTPFRSDAMRATIKCIHADTWLGLTINNNNIGGHFCHCRYSVLLFSPLVLRCALRKGNSNSSRWFESGWRASEEFFHISFDCFVVFVPFQFRLCDCDRVVSCRVMDGELSLWYPDREIAIGPWADAFRQVSICHSSSTGTLCCQCMNMTCTRFATEFTDSLELD